MQNYKVQDVDFKNAHPEHYNRQKIRQEIYQQVGDIETLLGTIADATQILLVGFSELVVNLSQTTTIAEIRSAASPLAEYCEPFLTKVNRGDVELPYLAKSLEQTIVEIGERAHQVTQILKKYQETKQNA